MEPDFAGCFILPQILVCLPPPSYTLTRVHITVRKRWLMFLIFAGSSAPDRDHLHSKMCETMHIHTHPPTWWGNQAQRHCQAGDQSPNGSGGRLGSSLPSRHGWFPPVSSRTALIPTTTTTTTGCGAASLSRAVWFDVSRSVKVATVTVLRMRFFVSCTVNLDFPPAWTWLF